MRGPLFLTKKCGTIGNNIAFQTDGDSALAPAPRLPRRFQIPSRLETAVLEDRTSGEDKRACPSGPLSRGAAGGRARRGVPTGVDGTSPGD